MEAYEVSDGGFSLGFPFCFDHHCDQSTRDLAATKECEALDLLPGRLAEHRRIARRATLGKRPRDGETRNDVIGGEPARAGELPEDRFAVLAAHVDGVEQTCE